MYADLQIFVMCAMSFEFAWPGAVSLRYAMLEKHAQYRKRILHLNELR